MCVAAKINRQQFVEKSIGVIFFLRIYVPVNSYGHVETVSSPNPELSETQNYAYWYARFFSGTHDFR